mmetsp:Transcript_20195/g.48538  ORF Transcript_20195/g.48538 Transcript_20195/m.48538 type:complete len:149 (+) Transcript_20195:149-595(+)
MELPWEMAVHPRFGTSIIKASELGDLHLAAAVMAAALIDQELVVDRESNLALGVRSVLNEGPRSFNGKQLLQLASRLTPRRGWPFQTHCRAITPQKFSIASALHFYRVSLISSLNERATHLMEDQHTCFRSDNLLDWMASRVEASISS